MNAVTTTVLVILLLWSFAEAFSWPIVPDAGLVAAVFLMPSLATSATITIIVGSIVGGAAAITLYRRGHRWPLPIVTEMMALRVAGWMDRGSTGLMYQPLTGVPYKAFVVEAARRDTQRVTWAILTAAFRGPRMATVAVVSVLAARGVEHFSAASDVMLVKATLVAAGAAVFAAGWRIVVRYWSATPEPLVATNPRQAH